MAPIMALKKIKKNLRLQFLLTQNTLKMELLIGLKNGK